MVTATMEIIFFSGAVKDLEPDFNHSLKENKGRTRTGIAFSFKDLKGSQSGCLEDGFRHQRQWQCQKTPYPSGPAGNKMNPHGLEGNFTFWTQAATDWSFQSASRIMARQSLHKIVQRLPTVLRIKSLISMTVWSGHSWSGASVWICLVSYILSSLAWSPYNMWSCFLFRGCSQGPETLFPSLASYVGIFRFSNSMTSSLGLRVLSSHAFPSGHLLFDASYSVITKKQHLTFVTAGASFCSSGAFRSIPGTWAQ